MRLGLQMQHAQLQVQKLSYDYSYEILVLIASPLITKVGGTIYACPQIAFHSEVAAIADACRLNYTRKLQVNPEFASIKNISRAFSRSVHPIIIHFIGHGSRTADSHSHLVLEHETGSACHWRYRSIASLLRRQKRPPCQLAILNACYSAGLATLLVDAGVNHVISIEAADTILDYVAQLFTEYFYPGLLEGRTVLDCYEAAREACETTLQACQPAGVSDAHTEILKFLLLPEDSSLHNTSLDFGSETGEVIVLEHSTTNIPPYFSQPVIGRQIDLFHILQNIESPAAQRCLSIRGSGGIGKTVLAHYLGVWLIERNRWPDGIWWIPAAAKSDMEFIITYLAVLLSCASYTADHVLAALSKMKTLLIIDDVDDIIINARREFVEFVTALRVQTPTVCLFTSRLQLPGEVYAVEYFLSSIRTVDATTMFIDVAFAGPEMKAPTAANDCLVQIVSFLDGVPFAVRLAATHLRETQCGLKELYRRLVTQPRCTLHYRGSQVDRNSSLFRTLEISYSVLPVKAKALFAKAAIFPSGMRDALLTVLFGEQAIEMAETLYRYSLIEIVIGHQGRRFRFLEPVRQFALELWLEVPEHERNGVYSKALKFYRDSFGGTFDVKMVDGPDDIKEVMRAYLVEEVNIESVLKWALSGGENGDLANAGYLILHVLEFKWSCDQTWFGQKEDLLSLDGVGAAKSCFDYELEARLYLLRGQVREVCNRDVEALAEYGLAEKWAKTGESVEYLCMALISQARVLRKIEEEVAAAAKLRDAKVLCRIHSRALEELKVSLLLGEIYVRLNRLHRAKMLYLVVIRSKKSSVKQMREAKVGWTSVAIKKAHQRLSSGNIDVVGEEIRNAELYLNDVDEDDLKNLVSKLKEEYEVKRQGRGDGLSSVQRFGPPPPLPDGPGRQPKP